MRPAVGMGVPPPQRSGGGPEDAGTSLPSRGGPARARCAWPRWERPAALRNAQISPRLPPSFIPCHPPTPGPPLARSSHPGTLPGPLCPLPKVTWWSNFFCFHEALSLQGRTEWH